MSKRDEKKKWKKGDEKIGRTFVAENSIWRSRLQSPHERQGVFLVRTKNAFVLIERVYSVNIYL